MLVAVVSVKGSPGVTTFSVALAASWPRPARTLLIEADPSGGDVGTRFSLRSAPGLVSLAGASRRSADSALLVQHAQVLPGGLPVVIAPPDADRARAALTALTELNAGTGIVRTAANAPDVVVIVDCGRIDAGSPVLPIVQSADAMVLLSRAQAEDLAHVARRLPTMGCWNAHPAMVLVGQGYSTVDVARELGVRPLGWVPDDPRGAAVLCGRPSRRRWGRRGPVRSPLGGVAYTIATVLAAQQTSSPALSNQVPTSIQLAPVAQPMPGAPGNPMSVTSVGPPSLPSGQPTFTNARPRGGAAS